MSVRTPNYITTEDFTYYPKGWGSEGKHLPAGAWVKPIHPDYVPKDTKERLRPLSEEETYAYCRHGIIQIPNKIIVER